MNAPHTARPTAAHRWSCLLAALVLLLAGAALHVLYLLRDCPIDLSGDEAHYWEWSRRLDLSYYSKGPLVAYIIAAGRAALAPLSVSLLGDETLAVRGPAILLSVITGFGLYVLAARTTGRPLVALGAVALTFTVPILAAGSMLMTIDAPLAATWVWALVAAHDALQTGRVRSWLACGGLIAIGLLAKFNMLLLFPAVGLAILLEPAYRHNLRRVGPYAATLVASLGMAPILIWNARHEWVSFRHVAGQAGLASATRFDPNGLVEYVLGQAAVTNPIWFIALALAVLAAVRRAANHDPNSGAAPARRLLVLATLTPYAAFLCFSPLTKIQPNWPMLGLLSGLVLLADWLADRLSASAPALIRRRTRWMALGGSVLGVSLVLLGHDTRVLMPLIERLVRDAPAWDLTPAARYDPTARLKGWRTLAAAVGELHAAQRAAGRDPFFLTDDYQTASLLAFYVPGNPPVYSAQSALGGRLSQYDLWENPGRDAERFRGRPVIYVGRPHAVLTDAGADHPAPLQGFRAERIVRFPESGPALQIWPIAVADAFTGYAPTTAPQRY